MWLLVTRNVCDVNGTPNCDFRLFLISSKLNIQAGLEAALLDSTAKVKWSKPHLCFGHSRNFQESSKHSINPEHGVLSHHPLARACSCLASIPALGSSLHLTSRPLFHPPGLETNCSLHWETFFSSHSTLFFLFPLSWPRPAPSSSSLGQFALSFSKSWFSSSYKPGTYRGAERRWGGENRTTHTSVLPLWSW